MSTENELNEVEVISSSQNANAGALAVSDTNYIIQQAEMAEKYIKAVNTIIEASMKITNERDWILIAGTPYLQQIGATKVAKVFGVSWKIIKDYYEMDKDGYKTFYVTLELWDSNQTIQVQGSRSMKDDFFSKPKDGNKRKPEEINEKDVKQSAITSAINVGIKNIVPGLRSVTVEDLAKAGIDTDKLKGYSFKTGSKGGTDQRNAETSGMKCEECGKPIDQKTASYSESYFHKKLCFGCQQKAKAAKNSSSNVEVSPDELFGK